MKTTACSTFYEQYTTQQNLKLLFPTTTVHMSIHLLICSTVLDTLPKHMLYSSYQILWSQPKFWPALPVSWYIQKLVPDWKMTKNECSLCFVVSCTIGKFVPPSFLCPKMEWLAMLSGRLYQSKWRLKVSPMEHVGISRFNLKCKYAVRF